MTPASTDAAGAPERSPVHGPVIAAGAALPHLKVLDGWRGLSILLVLVNHLIPLGHVANDTAGIAGMALFFILSGFLITSFLLKDGATLPDFLLRRFFRIVPLTWLYLVIVLIFQDETLRSRLALFLFYANLPPAVSREATGHLWSLCVEMQFYVGIALLFGLFRKRGLLVLPLLGLCFTGLRVFDGVYASSVTWYRIDEVLAGCTLALVFHGRLGRFSQTLLAWMRSTPQWALCVLLLLCSVHDFGSGEWAAYFRPYVAAFLVGTTLVSQDSRFATLLKGRVLGYLAAVSFAVYVIHIGLVHTWLGSGSFTVRYAKRPLLFVVLFVLAHLSTFYYERPLIAFGKRLSARLRSSRQRSQMAVDRADS